LLEVGTDVKRCADKCGSIMHTLQGIPWPFKKITTSQFILKCGAVKLVTILYWRRM
jgi:hypothetical protein